MAIQISGTTIIDDSGNLSNVTNASTLNCNDTYAIRSATGRICATGFDSPLSSSTPLGVEIEGGYLICKASSVGWIVSPSTSQVSRDWYSRDDANTRAQQVSGCTGWFVPTMSQLQNPGYSCRAFWDSYSEARYWSSSEWDSSNGCQLNFYNNSATQRDKADIEFVRSFRCVTY